MMNAKDLIALSVADARMTITNERNKLREMLVDFYESAQTAEDKYLRTYFKDRTALPLLSEDLTKRVIDRISMVYKKPPVRILLDKSGNEIEDSPLNEFENDNPQLAFAMKNAERYWNLLDNVLLRLDYDEERGFFFYIETQYIPHFDKYNKLYPVAYSIALRQETDSKTKQTEQRFLYVSDTEYFVHDESGSVVNDQLNETFDGVNPFGIMPVVDFSRFPVEEYWGCGAKPLIEANQHLNIATLEQFYGLGFQSTDQMYGTGIDPDDAPALKRSADQAWLTGSTDANFGLLNFNPKLVESTDMLERYLTRVLSHYGLSASFKEDGNPMSGVALQIKNMDLLERRESDVDFFRHKEQELYKVLVAMNDYHQTEWRIPEDATLKVDFADIEFPTDPAVEREDWNWKFQNNLATPADYLVSQNPDLTKEDAEKRLQENREANNVNRQRSGGLFRQIAEQPINEDEF